MPTPAPPNDPVDPYGATTPLPRAGVVTAVATVAAPKAEAPIRARGSGLFRKIFAAVAGTVVLVLLITLAVGAVGSRRAAQDGITAGLTQTATLIDNLLVGQESELAEKTKIYALTPTFRASIEAQSDSGNYLDAAQVMQETIGASWVQLIDKNGIRLARSDQPGAQPADLSGSPLVSGALSGETVHGFGLTADTVLFDAVAVPIVGAGGGAPVGVAMLARNISDSTADRIRRQTGSEVVFFSVDTLDNVHVVGVTDAMGDRAATAGTLKQLIMGDPNRPSATAAGRIGDMMMASASNMDSSMKAQDGVIGGRRYSWAMKPLQTVSGRVVGGVVALRDKDLALAPYRSLRNAILLSGLIALLLAFAIASGVARQITQPVRTLVSATRRAAEGDYAAEIPPMKGEIGALAEAFNQLLADLREKQSLVDFLQGPTSGKTMQAQAQRMGGGATVSGSAPRGASGTAPSLQAGQILANRYEIKRVLGAGGMGMVYKAVDRELGETVAIKTLRPEIMGQDPAALDRFRSEIRLARRISHRNVVRTHDIGEVDGLYFITMEFVEGSPLKDLIISRGRLPAAAVISIGKQLCRALEVAHEAGVIHRDIKPQNMVVEADGTVKVMDFGIARLQTRSDGHTQAGMVVGTPEYMSPEQLRGDDLDGRSDLYSAGVVLYEALTGKLPHIADTPGALIGKVLTEVPPPPRASVAEVSPTLSAAIMQALEKDRDQRPRTALEFLATLDRA